MTHRAPAEPKETTKPAEAEAQGDAGAQGEAEGSAGAEVRAEAGAEAELRISDAAAQAGVSARTLRYYEELGLLTPSGYTAGGERRYRHDDLAQLDRILELREVLGMNLDEVRSFLESDARLEQVREAYRASKGAATRAARARQKALLREALQLNESLAEQLDTRLARMDAFRARLTTSARRCRELLEEP